MAVLYGNPCVYVIPQPWGPPIMFPGGCDPNLPRITMQAYLASLQPKKQATKYGQNNAGSTNLPPVPVPQTPLNDDTNMYSGSGNIAAWFSNNQYYVYGAAAILLAAVLFKKKK